jgi:exopolysaccharide biosynthesis polyprenyl glycosylphosphotransferase
VIRLFRVYYPLRALVLLAVEALIVYVSFVLATIMQNRETWWILLNVEGGYLKILGVTVLVLLLSHWLDLYNTSELGAKWDQVFRLLLVLGFVALGLSAISFLFVGFFPGHWTLHAGIIILLVALYFWRRAYSRIVQLPYFRERVYVLGTGDRAERVLGGLRKSIGMEVVGWTGDLESGLTPELDGSSLLASGQGHRVEELMPDLEEAQLVASVADRRVIGGTESAQVVMSVEARETVPLTFKSDKSLTSPDRGGVPLNREAVATHLVTVVQKRRAHRVIVAMPDRRGTLPVEELLALRLSGVRVDEATSWLEKINGRIEVGELYPSWLIFAEGFRFSLFNRILRRTLNFSVALIGLIFALPILPFVALAVRLSSSGPIFYSQERVGKGGRVFKCHKFRTMRKDAEADTGATWAADNDPRITKVGKFLRASRLDEIPQLWCVLVGDMHFVGPRPERPEFVAQLSTQIPYYGVRHTVRPGITGWAQVQYKYGNTIEDAREKLQYDLFYIKNASIGLDFWIVFQTVKIVILGRGH